MFKRDQDLQFVEEHLENGRVKKYTKGRTLGKGGFAECFEFVSQETGKRYAAKVIDKESLAKGKTKEKLQSEIVIHKSLHHINIVKFQHYFQDHEFVYILLQLCTNNTLNQLLKRRKVLTELEVKYYLIQLLHALKYIHHQKVIHRDLKLGNFFLSESLQLKVGDFGLATTLTHQGQKRKTMCGTPNYIAPEILQSKKGHSYEVDIWSTGVIAFALLFGRPPFQTNEVKLTYERIKACEFSFPKLGVSEEARHFINRMLVLNPAERATLHELMTHQFITKQDIPKSLPLSTLACPPSKSFLQSVKNEEKVGWKKSKQEEIQHNINSSRTSKHSQKHQALAHQHFNLQFVSSKAQKSERSQGSIPRNSSSLAVLTRKNTTQNSHQDNASPLLVSFFEEQPKYGMFYTLANGATGMRFNDQTCLISNIKFSKFRYLVLQGNKEKQAVVFNNGQQPQSLQKKMKIITHFSKILSSKVQNRKQPLNPLNKLKEEPVPAAAYVDSYYSTNHYTLFSLSNGLFQAKFKDRSEILIEADDITFINKDRKRLLIKEAALGYQEEEFKIKYSHVTALVKKIKRSRAANSSLEDKKEKENTHNSQSNSQSKLAKVKQLSVKKQFSSTASLHTLKRPLCESSNNRGKVEVLRQKEKVF